MQYRTAQGETGTILLTYWTPMSGRGIIIAARPAGNNCAG